MLIKIADGSGRTEWLDSKRVINVEEVDRADTKVKYGIEVSMSYGGGYMNYHGFFSNVKARDKTIEKFVRECNKAERMQYRLPIKEVEDE